MSHGARARKVRKLRAEMRLNTAGLSYLDPNKGLTQRGSFEEILLIPGTSTISINRKLSTNKYMQSSCIG